ncbi:hypothetical protein D3C86_1566650 [compost metagenome]
MIFRGVQTELPVLDREFQLRTKLPGIPGIDVLAVAQLAGGEEHPLPALADKIRAAEVAACRGKARLVPLELVIGADADRIVQLPVAGHLLGGHQDFLELGARYRLQLHQVDGGLRIGDAVGPEEQTFAIDLGELTEPPGQRGGADFLRAIDEGIEDFSVLFVDAPGVAGELVVLDT